ncbi:MAG: type II secretion system protein [Candidatus Staskawiczbacteria bacterium]|nr:type II secretion system protein [Candidatus Staskawiczbacteria bacterium]
MKLNKGFTPLEVKSISTGYKKSGPLTGFTLIELIVVMAVFLFIIGAALGIFISIIQGQRRVLAEQQFLNQISYVQEYMAKALRAAKTDISGTCPGTNNIYLLTNWDGINIASGIKFLNNNYDLTTCQYFFLEGGVLFETKNGVRNPLTSSTNFEVKSLKFLVNRTADSASPAFASGNGIQPAVTILLNVQVSGETAIRTIQSTVSRRALNIVQ